MSPPSADLLVIGAGPAGSATAIRAAAAGLRVTLVDRAMFPREKACSEYMSPETLRHLDALGVLAGLEQAGGSPLAGSTVIGPRGSRLTGLFARAGWFPFRPTGLSVARRELDRRLVDAARARGVTVLEELTVTDLLTDRGTVSGAAARDRAGREVMLRAGLTVGADGLRSVVARRLGGQRRGIPARLAFVAHVRGVAGLGDRAEMHVGARGYVGLNALGDGVANVALVVPRGRAALARGNPTAFLFRTLEEFPGVRGRVDAGRMARPVMVTGPFASRARRVIAPGALLVGDAAEFFDPFTGEGIWTALRGAELAAAAAVRALERPGPADAAPLRGYVRARRRAFAGKRLVERLIGWGMHAPSLFDRALDRLESRGMGHTLVGVTGGFVPPRLVLNPRFLAGLLW